jgi:hypothetical protein
MDLERKELEEKCKGYYKANECTLRIFTLLNYYHQKIKVLIGEYEDTLDEVEGLIDEAKKLEQEYKKYRKR